MKTHSMKPHNYQLDINWRYPSPIIEHIYSKIQVRSIPLPFILRHSILIIKIEWVSGASTSKEVIKFILK